MKVHFEPVGLDIDCAAGETILDAAFRQGVNLVYGCREGQCSACKCFLTEGEVTLKRYSNFALSDSEQASGYSLMCRAMPEQDLVVELLHYDADALRLEHAIRDGEAVVESIEALTHDIRRLVLRAEEFAFTAGQYVDLHVPGEDDPPARRSFSMANLPGEDRIELIIKRYPGGRFSSLLDGSLAVGDRLGFTGPYGSLRMRPGERPIVMVAGGSGMAPILSLLRGLAAEGSRRPVRFFFGARAEEDLFADAEIAELAERLPDFRFTPVVGRFVHEAVDAYLADGELAEPDVYLCGPPPMIEAAEAMLIDTHGIDEARIFADRFVTSAAAGGTEAAAADGPPIKRLGDAPAEDGSAAERQFEWFTPRRRRASLYEDVTIDTQPSVHRHLTRGWPLSFADGRGTWNDASTALRSSDWFAFRDPGEQWERPFYQAGNAAEQTIEAALRSARAEGLLDDFAPGWSDFLRSFLQVPAYVEHGLWFAMATIARDCLSDSVATVVCLQAAMKQRSAQAIVLYALDLESHLGPFPIEEARDAFLEDPAWQPARRYLERLAAAHDWGEVIVAANLCLEPVLGTLIRRELGMRAASANGDTVTPVLARAASREWEWVRAWSTELCRMLLDDPAHGDANRERIAGWVGDWLPEAFAAAEALAPVAAQVVRGARFAHTLDGLRVYAAEVLAEAGLPELGESLGVESRPTEQPAPREAPAPVRRTRPPRAPRSQPTLPPPAEGGGEATFDFVGIVMAKSAEGDAVAEILGRRPEVEVREQPAFWDIRAEHRLEVPYAEVSEALGYEIDAYSIQHEMSTHYGRMVASDEALMLFSDPTEAMQYLMS